MQTKIKSSTQTVPRISQCAHNPVLADLLCSALQQLGSFGRTPVPFVEEDLQLPAPNQRGAAMFLARDES